MAAYTLTLVSAERTRSRGDDAENDRPQAIVDAALRCFERWGLARTRMEDIAREAGVARTVLYRHFASRDDLQLAVIVGHIDEQHSGRLIRIAQHLGLDQSASIAQVGQRLMARLVPEPLKCGAERSTAVTVQAAGSLKGKHRGVRHRLDGCSPCQCPALSKRRRRLPRRYRREDGSEIVCTHGS